MKAISPEILAALTTTDEIVARARRAWLPPQKSNPLHCGEPVNPIVNQIVTYLAGYTSTALAAVLVENGSPAPTEEQARQISRELLPKLDALVRHEMATEPHSTPAALEAPALKLAVETAAGVLGLEPVVIDLKTSKPKN